MMVGFRYRVIVSLLDLVQGFLGCQGTEPVPLTSVTSFIRLECSNFSNRGSYSRFFLIHLNDTDSLVE